MSFVSLRDEVATKQVQGASALDPTIIWTGLLKPLFQTAGIISDPSLPTMPTPAMSPAPAPKTAPKMENWTPADVGEAYAQKQVQYESDAAAVQRNATNTPGADGSITTVDSSGLNAWLLAALAVGGISLFIATRNRK